MTQLGVQMGTQIHRSTIAGWKVWLHVAIQACNHKLFAELSSRMGAEMLPIDDGAARSHLRFRCSHHSPQVGRYEYQHLASFKAFRDGSNELVFAIQTSWKLLHSRAVRGVLGAPQGHSRYLAHGRRYGR